MEKYGIVRRIYGKPVPSEIAQSITANLIFDNETAIQKYSWIQEQRYCYR